VRDQLLHLARWRRRAADKWHFPSFDGEMGPQVGAGFATAGAMLMGRVLCLRAGQPATAASSITAVRARTKSPTESSASAASGRNGQKS
jgi:hypothetical protein